MAVDPLTLPYRPCVGIMLLNPAGQVFVGRRLDTRDSWQMPQGGIDDGETAEQAALRELAEEIGTDRATILAQTDDWLRYDLPPHLLGKAWGGRYRGQEQRWVVCRFIGTDADIRLDTPHPEFDAWKWADIDALLDLIVPFKRQIYAEVIRRFRHLAVAQPLL